MAETQEQLQRSSFLRAARGLSHPTVPVWFMRQAGRALPEYRRIRDNFSFEEVVRTPELAAEVTLQPVHRYGVDAAILFSDIVTPLQALGIGIDIRPGIGPVLDRPFRRDQDVERLRALEPESDLSFMLDTVDILVEELEVPLIGFAGAPFTLASYLIEGGPSRSYSRTKAMMLGNSSMWHALMSRLAEITLASLRAQVAHGASAIQLFDSWAGALHPQDYVDYVLPHSMAVFHGLEDLSVSRIHFGVNTGELLGLMAEAGADVVGVDWRVPLSQARQRIPEGVGFQGNLEPAVCLAPWELVEERVRSVLIDSDGRPDYIFNLGHGVLPDTDPGILRQVVDFVHEQGTVRPDAMATVGEAPTPVEVDRDVITDRG